MSECHKRAFKSKRAAREAVKSMGNSVRVYSCPNCGRLHVTKDRYDEIGHSAAGRHMRHDRVKRYYRGEDYE